METKFELLDGVIEQFGLTPQEVIAHLSKKIEMPTIIPSKKFKTPTLIQPGMFCYADGLIHPEFIKNEQISSVVGSVQGNQILLICLREKKLHWSSDYLFLDVDNHITSGKELTKLILEASACQDKKVEAAQYCHEYCEDGVEQGSAFLPSIEELKIFNSSKKTINSSFCKLHAPELKGVYWSSSEHSNNFSWVANFNYSYGLYNYHYGKDNTNDVRPVLELFI